MAAHGVTRGQGGFVRRRHGQHQADRRLTTLTGLVETGSAVVPLIADNVLANIQHLRPFCSS